MHEVGITKDIVEALNKQIQENPDVTHVKKVFLRLGRSMGITQESLIFWFGQFSSGTKLQGAALDITIVDGKGITIDEVETE